MASALLLTPLRDKGHNFKTQVDPGAWRPIAGTLGELGRALDVNETAAVDVVRSTPDPWSQARGFADAILATTRPSAMVSQWRGLLALFALKESFADRYQLETIAVPLAGSSSRFAAVMRQLLPAAALPVPAGEVDGGWDRPVIVRVFAVDRERRRTGTGRDVGLLNPACLVAGGRALDTLTLPGVPWCQNGMTDPAAPGTNALSAPALQTIAAFAERLADQVAALCGDGGDDRAQELVSALRRRLAEFARDCRDPARHPGVDAKQFALIDGDAWGEALAPLYRLLTVPLKPKPAQPGESDCILKLRDDIGGAPSVKGLVLLDPQIAAATGRPANTIAFWGSATLADAVEGGAGVVQGLRDAIAADGYLLVTPDELFAPVLMRLDDPEQPARLPAHPDSLADCLLPLSPLVLLLRTPEQLRDDVALSRDNRVSLTLTLGTEPYKLTRRFVEQPGAGQGQLLGGGDWELGDVAIWPDFKSERWHHYCARIDYPKVPNRLRGRFAMSGRLLANLLRASQDDPRRLAPWGDPAPLDNGGDDTVLDLIKEFAGRSFIGDGLTRFRAASSPARASEVQVATAPFEATFFTVAARGDRPPVPAGLALVLPTAVDTPLDRDGEVAIDFGTTNTVACLNSLAPLRLKARIIHPIQPARAAAPVRAGEVTQKLRDFLPADDRVLPTPTVIYARPLDTAGRDLLDANGTLDDALLVRHLMYFQPDFAEDGTISAVKLEDWSALLNSIRYNLKWDRTPEMRNASRRFLRQLMLMVASEWAADRGDPARLRWLFSRPEGMSEDDNADFTAQLRSALDDVVPRHGPEALRRLIAEGEAAAKFILDENTKVGTGTKGALNIILDIGGGTTDIAIWTNDAEPRRILSESVRLAGGDFFTDQILQNSQILSDFGLKTWTDVVQQLRGDADGGLKANIHYIGELLFSGHTLKDAIDRSWSKVSGTDNVRALKETAFLYLGGIAWLVGRHLRNLIEVDKVIDRSALSDIAVAFCGRGAGLFARLHGDEPRARTDIARLMLLIGAAAGERQPPYPQVQVSPSPKIEVAAGMILMARAGEDQPLTVAQPASDEGGFDFGGLDAPDVARDGGAVADTPKAIATRETGIEDLRPFLQAFGMVSGIRIDVDDAQRAKLNNGIADVNRDDARAGRERQWEFAAVLKVLVGLMRARPGEPLRPKTSWTR